MAARARECALTAPAIVPTVGATYTAAPCDAGGKGVALCGSTSRLWLAPERLPEPVEPHRRGWWHARCVRCDAPFLWRPDPAAAEREEVWTVALRGSDLDLLDALAAGRDAASPDAFGPLGHRANVVRDALAAGLRALAADGGRGARRG